MKIDLKPKLSPFFPQHGLVSEPDSSKQSLLRRFPFSSPPDLSFLLGRTLGSWMRQMLWQPAEQNRRPLGDALHWELTALTGLWRSGVRAGSKICQLCPTSEDLVQSLTPAVCRLALLRVSRHARRPGKNLDRQLMGAAPNLKSLGRLTGLQTFLSANCKGGP